METNKDEKNLDELELFVTNHREDFDNAEPSAEVWEKVSESLSEEQRSPKVVKLRTALLYGAAAMLAVAFGIGYLLTPEESVSTSGVNTAAEEPVENIDGYSLSDISPELAEVEGYYVSQVNKKMDALNQLNVDPELLEELEMLDSEFQQLKSEMGESVNNEQIIEAMIDNYRLKLDILETILQELAEIEKEDKNEEATVL